MRINHTVRYCLRRGIIPTPYREAIQVLLKYSKNFRVLEMREKVGILELKCHLIQPRHKDESRIKKAWDAIEHKWYMELRHNEEKEISEITIVLNPPECFIPKF